MNTAHEELQSFTAFVQERLESGGGDLSLDEMFDLWRAENPSDALYAENVTALKAAIEDFRQGDRGTPAGEHSDALRRSLDIE